MDNCLLGKYIYCYESIVSVASRPDMLHVELNDLSRTGSIEVERLSGYPGMLATTTTVPEMRYPREVQHKSLYGPAYGSSRIVNTIIP